MKSGGKVGIALANGRANNVERLLNELFSFRMMSHRLLHGSYAIQAYCESEIGISHGRAKNAERLTEQRFRLDVVTQRVMQYSEIVQAVCV